MQSAVKNMSHLFMFQLVTGKLKECHVCDKVCEMSFTVDITKSQEYVSFRSCVPLRKIVVDTDSGKVINK